MPNVSDFRRGVTRFCLGVKYMLVRFFIIMLLIVPQWSCTLQSISGDNSKLVNVKTIAILPFTSNNVTVGHKISDTLSEYLVTSRFKVIGYRQLQEMLARQGISLEKTGMNINEVIGKLEGVDAIVIGTATQKIAEYGLPFYGNSTKYVSSSTARVIDAKNGTVLLVIEYNSLAPYLYYDISTPEKVASNIADTICSR